MTKHPGLKWIAVYKLITAICLVAITFSLFQLIHADLTTVANNFISALQMDPDNRYIHNVLERFINLSPQSIRHAGLAMSLYSVLVLAEGIGLWLGKRWAEYLVLVATGFFIPIEVYEIHQHITSWKIAILVTNVIIMIYIWAILFGRKTPAKAGS